MLVAEHNLKTEYEAGTIIPKGVALADQFRIMAMSHLIPPWVNGEVTIIDIDDMGPICRVEICMQPDLICRLPEGYRGAKGCKIGHFYKQWEPRVPWRKQA